MRSMVSAFRGWLVGGSRSVGGVSLTALLAVGAVTGAGWAQRPYQVAVMEHDAAGRYGPFAGHFLIDGKGLAKPVAAADPLLKAGTPWTLSAWFEAAAGGPQTTLIAGLGDPLDESSRFLALDAGRPAIRFADGRQVAGSAAVTGEGWHLLTAVFDGTQVALYLDGAPVASGAAAPGAANAKVELAPDLLSTQESAFRYDVPHLPPTVPAKMAQWHHFGGRIAGFTLEPAAHTAAEVKAMAGARPDFEAIVYEDGSKHWPYQTRGQAGYQAPQDPATLPVSRAPLGRPVAQPAPPAGPALVAAGADGWSLANGWRLAAVPLPPGGTDVANAYSPAGAPGVVSVTDGPEAVSQAGYNARGWYAATVPGTVLTTLIERGVYPDSDYGLNNLAIPETLNKQQFWYRMEFPTPDAAAGSRLTMTFNGINYAAEVWLNGQQLGSIKGAFVRGIFDVTTLLKPGGTNAVAVRITPPPHPGIPQEQSIKGGPGENGGEMVLDGPTFVATEGWDWIPGIRDRNIGLWQGVMLTATRELQLGDAQVVTELPLPDISSADVEIGVPVKNLSAQAVEATIRAEFEGGVIVSKQVSVPPGETRVTLAPAEFRQLHLEHPRLWWPNGYGKPELYHLQLSVSAGGAVSDRKAVQFGVREVSYEESLYDTSGHLRRVEVRPTVAHLRHEQVVDVSHNGMRELPLGWAASLTAAGDGSPAVRPVTNEPDMTDLVLKVNGVRIAARGGNWGMDDSRKRVSREHLEPYFRLHQVANVNIIRNWVGQNTEQAFYDLADEYGMMVWNDFWESTENYNAEAEDPQLFFANARDVVKRFGNHPSIVMWCGRNEGVPQPVINEGLVAILHELDGTRYYSPTSNQLNLRNSGPYKYEDPKLYYSTLNRGFSVELGIPSLSTLEALQHSIAPADQWPISDAWAYHDWHQLGNGAVAPFMQELDAEFGAGTGLVDFERKAQMLNYTLHRAIFEGFNQHLWAPNAGRMLWMTQPAWPSNEWQILSSDYDTQGSFYGVKKAAEPQHIQLDLSNGDVAVVNTTREPLPGAKAEAEVYSLSNERLLQKTVPVSLDADQMTTAFRLELAPLLEQQGVVLARLRLLGAKGEQVSTNLYWLSSDAQAMRKLGTLAPAKIRTVVESSAEGRETRLRVTLTNQGRQAALALKLTPLHAADGERILPAYLSDNYISLLPGESRTITIDYPGQGAAKVGLRGWNLEQTAVPVGR
ncbi:MAG TPA: LamG-like jellyroll fold domain-containing protein [Acidobacteriaceae bacterium]